jgi:hypothetical protein
MTVLSIAAPQDADVLPAAVMADLGKHSQDPGGEPDALLVLLDGAGKVGDESHDSQSHRLCKCIQLSKETENLSSERGPQEVRAMWPPAEDHSLWPEKRRF